MTDDISAPLINKKQSNQKIFTEDNIEDEEKNINELSNQLKKKVNKDVLLKNHIICKIYLLFFLQLSITYLFIYYSFKNEVFHNLIKNKHLLFGSSVGLTAIIFYGSYKWKEILQTVPFNYFFFLVFTISISFIICKIVIFFEFKTIAFLWVLTLIMILSLAIYAYNSSKEIDIIHAVIFVSLILISISIIIEFVAKIHIFSILLMLLCLITLAIYLVYEVLTLIKEKKIGDKDYILVNVYLYTDIILLFVRLIKFIHNSVIKDNENSGLNELIKINEEIEKGFKEVKNMGNKSSDDGDDGDYEDDESDDKKGKGKEKKSKKGKKDNKGKKDDKGKKGKKEKGKKDKKEDKKEKKDKKGKKSKKSKKDDDDDDDFFNEENTKKLGKEFGNFFSQLLGH